MNPYCWHTDEVHANNTVTMNDWIENHNTQLDIYLIDGTYAEGIDQEGNTWEVHASGDGDFNNHKIEFELIGVEE
jgi:hypothetical protein